MYYVICRLDLCHKINIPRPLTSGLDADWVLIWSAFCRCDLKWLGNCPSPQLQKKKNSKINVKKLNTRKALYYFIFCILLFLIYNKYISKLICDRKREKKKFELESLSTKLTHPIFERWHDLHVLSRDPELVSVDVICGAALLSLLSICLHRCTAILPVQSHTDHSRKISLQDNCIFAQILCFSALPPIYGLWIRLTVHTLGQSSPAYPALTEYEPMSKTRAPTSSA